MKVYKVFKLNDIICLKLQITYFKDVVIYVRYYGDKITTKASDFMKNNYPNIKGFTKRNIERMV